MPSRGHTLTRLAEHAVAIVVAAGLAVMVFGWSSSLRRLRPSDEIFDDPEANLPTDPKVLVDSLENGLRYYVRQNDAPARTAELRLVVKAGSVLESDDQRGLAHAVEHMAFRGTKHFPGEQLVDYLQSLGMRQGQDVNAYTDFDETVYRLTIPTSDSRVLDRGMTILADWAEGLRFDSADAARERGVVFEEWRSERDAGRRIFEARTATLLAGSRYAARLPIGDTAVLARFDVGAMRRFYHDWYRPDLMAVVAVGDFSPSRVRALIREHFGPMPRRADAPPRPDYDALEAGVARPSVAVLTDTEATRARVALWRLERKAPERTVSDVRARVARELFDALLDARLAEASRRDESPLRGATTSRPELAHGTRGFVVSADVPRDGILAGVDALVTEVERARRDGFSQPELERQRRIMSRDTEQRLAVYTTPNSSNLAQAYVGNFLDGQPMLARSAMRALYQRLVPAIRLDEVNGLAREYGADRGRLVVITTSRAGTLVPDSAVVRQTVADAIRRPIAATRDTGGFASLMPRRPEAGRITGEREIPQLQVVEWTLANGMRVLLKPTHYRANQILLTAWAPGGASLASDSDYVSAFMADRVVDGMGVGAFDERQLERALAGTDVEVTPLVTDNDVSLRGETSPTDLALLFQLVHLYFTAPRMDTAAFTALRDNLRRGAAGRAADPDAVFRDTIAVTLGGHSVRERPPSPKLYDELDLRRAIDFWRQRTANGSNFTVFLVGSFDPSEVRELVEQYLASIPAGKHEQPRDAGVRYASGIAERVVRRGIAPRGDTRVVFTGDADPDPRAMQRLHLLRELLSSTLEGKLRDSLGGTYGVDVDITVEHPPFWEYALSVEFSAAPAKLDALTTELFAEIDRLRRAGPTPQELSRLKAVEGREIDTGLEDNDFWLEELESHVRMGWPLEHIARQRQEIEQMGADDLRLAAQRYLRSDRYVRVTRLPGIRN